MRRLSLFVLFALAACGNPREEAAQKAEETIPTIAAGTYSNAVDEGEGTGWRVTLAAGERSTSAAISHCAPECADPVDVPLRAGMAGLMGDYRSTDGRIVTLAIRPHGQGIEVSADWGEGLESDKLKRVEAAAVEATTN